MTNNLIYMSVYNGFLGDIIKQLYKKARKMILVQSLRLVEETVKCIKQVQGPLGVAILEKMLSVLNTNP